MNHIPDLAIFRVPDDNGEKNFAEVTLIDGVPQEHVQIFSLNPETIESDSYNELDFNHIVLATRVDGGSIDICRFELETEDGEKAEIHSDPQLGQMIAEAYNEYMKQPQALN